MHQVTPRSDEASTDQDGFAVSRLYQLQTRSCTCQWNALLANNPSCIGTADDSAAAVTLCLYTARTSRTSPRASPLSI